MKEIDDAGRVFEVTTQEGGVSRDLREPSVLWESETIEARAGEPVTLRAVLVDYDGEPRLDDFPEALVEIGGRRIEPAPIESGRLELTLEFAGVGEHRIVLHGVGARSSSVVVRVKSEADA
jgi:hypothetical protein